MCSELWTAQSLTQLRRPWESTRLERSSVPFARFTNTGALSFLSLGTACRNPFACRLPFSWQEEFVLGVRSCFFGSRESVPFNICFARHERRNRAMWSSKRFRLQKYLLCLRQLRPWLFWLWASFCRTPRQFAPQDSPVSNNNSSRLQIPCDKRKRPQAEEGFSSPSWVETAHLTLPRPLNLGCA